MRSALVLILFVACGSAEARNRCFQLTPETEITVLPSIFPDTLILEEQARDGVFAGNGVKRLSWLGRPSSEFYSDTSHWAASGSIVTAVLRSEFDGFKIEFELGASETLGTAQPFVDIPGERPVYVIRVNPVECPQA